MSIEAVIKNMREITEFKRYLSKLTYEQIDLLIFTCEAELIKRGNQDVKKSNRINS